MIPAFLPFSFNFLLIFQSKSQSLGCSSMVEHLPGIYKALGSMFRIKP